MIFCWRNHSYLACFSLFYVFFLSHSHILNYDNKSNASNQNDNFVMIYSLLCCYTFLSSWTQRQKSTIKVNTIIFHMTCALYFKFFEVIMSYVGLSYRAIKWLMHCTRCMDYLYGAFMVLSYYLWGVWNDARCEFTMVFHFWVNRSFNVVPVRDHVNISDHTDLRSSVVNELACAWDLFLLLMCLFSICFSVDAGGCVDL